MERLLNHQLDFGAAKIEVVRQKRLSYDPSRSFRGPITKMRLERGTSLYRLIGVVNGEYFDDFWWIPAKTFDQARREAFATPSANGSIFRQYIAETLALPRGDYQLSVVQIELTQPVYAWVGKASSLFFRSGGAEQVFLPNLSEPRDARRSPYAKVTRTFWLQF